MAATNGTITLGGKTYTWVSPTFEALALIETSIGPLNAIVNTANGRIHLLAACLKEHQPDVNPGQLGKDMRATDWDAVWGVITRAVPLWELPKDQTADGRKQPSESATDAGDGDPVRPGESA